MIQPVIKGVAAILAHAPSFIRHGSKPSREIAADPGLLPTILSHLRSYREALSYAPHQVFIGRMRPDGLRELPTPWLTHPVAPERFGPFGEVLPEEELCGLLALADECDLLALDAEFAEEVTKRLADHPILRSVSFDRVREAGRRNLRALLDSTGAVPLFTEGRRLIGAIRRGHEEDESLAAPFLLENLAGKATGALALLHLVSRDGLSPDAIEYVLGCSEEAVGDRYQRGGGNLGKAMAEMAGCGNASGADIKNFCAAPIPALVVAGSLVASGVFENVAVVGGGSLAKLGMKFRGHLKHRMPILEDVLAGIAVWVGRDDGRSPRIRLDAVGRHEVKAGSSNQAILEALVARPLAKLGRRITEVGIFATELHNPEITVPQGNGDVPLRNYRTLAALAALRGEIEASQIDGFVLKHGMPGFAPTQGHLASAICFLGHAREMLMAKEIETVQLIAKGSLFLGMMSRQSDGMSVLIEAQ
jgi:hypothetical protein